jgi:hypothetical protein
MARLKSLLTFTEQDVSNSTEPNWLPGEPHKATSPLFRLIDCMVFCDGTLLLLVHETSTHKNKLKNKNAL